MTRLGSLARDYWFDGVVVVLVAEAMLEAVLRQGSQNAPATTLWFVLPALALMGVPLLARRRFPFAGPAAYWLLALAYSFVDGRLVTFETTIFVLGMAAAFLLGNLQEALQARIGLAVVVVSAAIIDHNVPDSTPGEQIFIPLLFGVCWLGGFALHGRAEQAVAAESRASRAEWEREAAARIAVAEERARIARELHDVVAHSVSVMVLQVGAVRHKLPRELDEDKDALRHVEQAGRTALAEMRRLLGAMGRNGDQLDLAPQPGLDGLDTLLDEVGRAGLPVRLNVDGDPFPLPRAIDLSAYRIVQEGLTNALKHAHASRADVTVHYRANEVELEIADDGAGIASTDGLGHGLVGIRERVKIYGGEMTAGARPAGGFVLAARLPLEGYQR